MKTTDQMIQSKDLWGGMNRPGISTDEAEVVVFGIPFDGGVSFRSGTREAPLALRDITWTVPPTTELFQDISDLKVLDIGDFEATDRDALFDAVRAQVRELVRSNRFFTMIGGDHSVTIPVLQGIDGGVDEPFGIIHIDAHFDLCDTLGGDRLSHGSTERRALELQHVGGPERIFFIGTRSVEPDELAYMNSNPVNVISAARFQELGAEQVAETVCQYFSDLSRVFITLDIDCLDPAYAAGTGTPQFGGLTARELLTLLRGLFRLPVIGFDVVEIAPRLDPSLAALFAGRKIIMECWGHQHKKLRG